MDKLEGKVKEYEFFEMCELKYFLVYWKLMVFQWVWIQLARTYFKMPFFIEWVFHAVYQFKYYNYITEDVYIHDFVQTSISMALLSLR